MSTEAHEPVSPICGDLASYWKAANDRVLTHNWELSRQIGALQKVGEQCPHPQQTTVREAAEAVTKGFSALEVLLAAQDADIPDAEPLWVKVSGRREEIGTYGQLRALRRALNLAHPQQGGERDGWKLKAAEEIEAIAAGWQADGKAYALSLSAIFRFEATAPLPHSESKEWNPIAEARHDCTLYELEVPSDGRGLRDAETSITIGSNNGDHDGEDRWTYAGWSWCQDRYIHMDTADGAPMPIRFREIRPDHLGRSASEPDPAVSPGNGHHLSYSGKPMPPDGIEGCVYCGQPFKEGDLVLSEVEGGEGHVTCMGPERDSYVGADGEPLKDGEPIPTGRPWIPTSPSKSSGEEA